MTKEEFSVLFPEKEIIYKEQKILSVHPISVKDMPKVSNIIQRLLVNVNSGMSKEELPFRMFDDLVSLVPYSITINKEFKDLITIDAIPGTILPQIIDYIVELNVDEVVIKNWSALITKIGEKLMAILGEKTEGEVIQGKVKDGN